MKALWQLSAIEQAAMVANRKVSSLELVDAHLARIDAVNPKINAVVRVMAEEARAAARQADSQVAAGAKLGPLHGVPFTIKENIDVAGLPTTHGCKALEHAVVSRDAPVVERMRGVGAIALARTNLPDLGLRVHTDSSLHGLTRNPWNLARTAAGSSGGEGAALASGMSPIGLGNDIGGSLRNPASACGIASIKPSAGRVPNVETVPGADPLLVAQQMLAQGPMARRVADVRLGLQILMGAHPRDPWSISLPFAGEPLQKPLRIAMVAEPPGGSIDPVIAATVRKAGAALSDAGYRVDEVCPPSYEEALQVWNQFLFGDVAAILDKLYPIMGESGARFLRYAYEPLPTYDAKAMSLMYVQRHAVAREWSVFMEDYPLVLSPTWTQLPFEHGFDAASAAGAAAAMEMMRPVRPANLLGLPSACVPAGRDEKSGLPIGVLLTGRRYRDDLCLDAAEAVEARLGLATPIDPAT
jgi:amidase